MSKEKSDEPIFKIVEVFFISVALSFYVCFKGTFRINYKNPFLYLYPVFLFILSMGLVIWDFAHLRFLKWVFPELLPVCYWFYSFGSWVNVGFLFFLSFYLILLFSGVVEMTIIKKYQRAIDNLGLKSPKGDIPKVKRVIQMDSDRFLLKVYSPGVPPTEWEKKKDTLKYELKKSVDEIKTSKKHSFVEIHLAQNTLPSHVSYNNYDEEVIKPFSFIVGESKRGLITQSIRSCPHVLMGGATGTGKSTAFKLMLYSMLKNTPHKMLNLVLLDLKRGVEVSDFQDFPNVEIAKTESDALSTLKKVVKEMYSRYEYFEKKEDKEH